MNIILGILIILFAAVLSVTIFLHMPFANTAPDILFTTLIIFSIKEKFPRFLVYNFFASIFYGLLSNLPFPAAALPLFIGIAAVNIFFQYYLGEFNYFIVVIYTIAASAIFKLLEIFSLYFYNILLYSSLFQTSVIKTISMQIIHNVLLVIIIFWLLKRLKIIKD